MMPYLIQNLDHGDFVPSSLFKCYTGHTCSVIFNAIVPPRPIRMFICYAIVLGLKA